MSAQEQNPTVPSRIAAEAAEWDAGNGYEAVAPHWFYCKVTGGRERWLPFSVQDSERLEEAHGAGKGAVRSPGCLHRSLSAANAIRHGDGAAAIAFSCQGCASIAFCCKHLIPCMRDGEPAW